MGYVSMTWVVFTSADQAIPGTRMRPPRISKTLGRPKSSVVVCRESRRYMGSVILFKDGTFIQVSAAKSAGWLVLDKTI